MVKKKDLSVETVRGIALLLMVAAHVIGANAQEGLKLDDESTGRYLYFSLMHIRMPLFTVISGYVYSLKPVIRDSSLLNFFKGKSRRLLLPLFSLSTIQFLFQCYVPGVNTDVEISGIWKIYFLPYSHFWFIQAIFLVFVMAGLADYFQLMRSAKGWGIVLFVSCCLFLVIKKGAFFSISRAFYLLPFFVLGCGLKRFEQTLKKRRVLTGLITILIIAFTLQQLTYFNIVEIPVHRRSLLGLIVGLSATPLLLLFRFKSGFLAKIGYYSYGIFLLHLFGTASSRIVISHLGFTPHILVLFTISLTVGIIVPILMEIVIIRYNWSKRLLLGMR